MRKQDIVASSARTVPNAPSITAATDVGTNRPYNDAQINLTVTPGFDGKLPITEYRATSTPGSIVGTSATSAVSVTGLASATSYTFAPRVSNGVGPSQTGSSTSPILATTVPQNPGTPTALNVTGIAFGSSPNITASFTAGANGGKAITAYQYSTNGGSTFATASGTSSPLTLTAQSTGSAFSAGVSYNVILRALNANGTSTSSGTSNTTVAGTVPQAPTIGTASRVSNTVARVPWTAGNNGGYSLSSIFVESNPSISLTYTTTDLDGSVDVTGSFASGTGYTFRVRAANANGNSAFSAFSNSVIVNPSAPPPPPVFTAPPPVFTPPVFTAPPPVFTAPPPVFTAPPPVFTAPPPVFTAPPPVFTPPSFSIVSDIRDKSEVESLTLGLDFINKVEPVTYKWNKRDKTLIGDKDFGFIAQDLAKLEDSVDGHEWLRLTDRRDPEQYKIKPERLIPILINAIQELSAEIEKLKNNKTE